MCLGEEKNFEAELGGSCHSRQKQQGAADIMLSHQYAAVNCRCASRLFS